MTEIPIEVGREMTVIELSASNIKNWFIRQRRKLPYLVWYNDELDVTVTFREARLQEFRFDPKNGFPAGALDYLNKGRMAEIERALGDIGIGFDKGGGFDGRDWEWDWSLSGPISVKFRHRATKPELRK